VVTCAICMQQIAHVTTVLGVGLAEKGVNFSGSTPVHDRASWLHNDSGQAVNILVPSAYFGKEKLSNIGTDAACFRFIFTNLPAA